MADAATMDVVGKASGGENGGAPRRRPGPARTLVVTLGQLRAASVTWTPFKTFVLDELDADLAVCLRHDDHFDAFNPFYRHARYRWTAPDRADVGTYFDEIAAHLGSTADWRILFAIDGNLWGGIADSGQPGSGSISLYLRWLILDNIRALNLTETYDRFIITRSDYLFKCPHPPLGALDPHYVWVPNGEGYGGYTDRHIVLAAADVEAGLNLLEPLLRDPEEMLAAMRNRVCNIETHLLVHFERTGLNARVRRFPYIMHLVRTQGDPTSWSHGGPPDHSGISIKYPGELQMADAFAPFLTSAADWRLYFAIQGLVGRLSNDWQDVLTTNHLGALDGHSKSQCIQMFSRLFHEAQRRGGIEHCIGETFFAFIVFVLRYANHSHAQIYQDLWVFYELRRKLHGFFVEVGAGDGRTWSNTLSLEQAFGWSGLLVEADPKLAADCRAARRAPCVEACVTGVDGEAVSFLRASDRMFSAVDRYSERDQYADRRRDAEAIAMTTRSLTSILDEAKAPRRIDFLSIDTNGAELDILNSLDFDRYDVRAICVLHNHVDTVRAELHARLTALGFARRFEALSHWDDWYVRDAAGLDLPAEPAIQSTVALPAGS